MRADRVENGNHAQRRQSEQSRNLVNKRLGKKIKLTDAES